LHPVELGVSAATELQADDQREGLERGNLGQEPVDRGLDEGLRIGRRGQRPSVMRALRSLLSALAPFTLSADS